MATLRDLHGEDLCALPSRLLIGRAPSCALRLDDLRVSGEHASIRWTGTGWEIRDLGSRNGTFVDGARLGPGEVVALAAGAGLGFGEAGPSWELLDAGPPGAVGRDLETGAVVAATSGLLALPSEEDPAVLVYPDERGRWCLEREELGPAVIEDGDLVKVGGRAWRIHLPGGLEGTATAEVGPRIDTVHLRFAVSRDEEYVDLSVIFRGKQTHLEHREHWYLLLTLARARLEDRAAPSADQGWVDRDRLLRMHRVDSNALNVAIYRARGQLSAIGVDGAAGIVEVRRGQRRIGVDPARLAIVSM